MSRIDIFCVSINDLLMGQKSLIHLEMFIFITFVYNQGLQMWEMSEVGNSRIPFFVACWKYCVGFTIFL